MDGVGKLFGIVEVKNIQDNLVRIGYLRAYFQKICLGSSFWFCS